MIEESPEPARLTWGLTDLLSPLWLIVAVVALLLIVGLFIRAHRSSGNPAHMNLLITNMRQVAIIAFLLGVAAFCQQMVRAFTELMLPVLPAGSHVPRQFIIAFGRLFIFTLISIVGLLLGLLGKRQQ